jgi:hypothetical protein
MRRIGDPSILTPDERLSEVASILATGVLLLRARVAVQGDLPAPECPPDSRPTCLEVSGETVLSVQTG